MGLSAGGGAYTQSKACVKEKVGLSAGGLIGGEIRYVIFQVDDSRNCDYKSSNEEIFPEILTG